MGPEEFEALVRRELKTRDSARRARLMDQLAYDAADAGFVAAVMQAAGYDAPAEAEKAVRKGRRARQLAEAAAFGDYR